MPKIPRKSAPQKNTLIGYYTAKKGNNKQVGKAESGPGASRAREGASTDIINVDEEVSRFAGGSSSLLTKTQESPESTRIGQSLQSRNTAQDSDYAELQSSPNQDIVRTSPPIAAVVEDSAEDGEMRTKTTRKKVEVEVDEEEIRNTPPFSSPTRLISKKYAMKLYRLDPKDMSALKVHEERRVTPKDPNYQGEDVVMFLYLEMLVEVAAWRKRGSRDNFVDFLYKLLQSWAKTHKDGFDFPMPELYIPTLQARVQAEADKAMKEAEENQRLYLSLIPSRGPRTARQIPPTSQSSQAGLV